MRLSRTLSLAASLLALSAFAGSARAEAPAASLLVDAVQRAAARNLPDTITEVEVHSVSLRTSPDVRSSSDVSVRVRADGSEDWIGRTRLEFFFTVDGEAMAPVAGTAEIVAWVQVPVLREPVPRGETVRADHLAMASREADVLPGGILRDPAAIIGRAAKRDLGLNALVRSTDLGPTVHAERNRPVTLLVGSGSLKVTATGVLRQDAALGDLVAVWVPSTNSTLHGILRSPDLVELPFGQELR